MLPIRWLPISFLMLDPVDDPWLGVDKLQHFLFTAAVTAAAYLAAHRSSLFRKRRLLVGTAAGVVAGLLKELGDVLQVGLTKGCRRQAAGAGRALSV